MNRNETSNLHRDSFFRFWGEIFPEKWESLLNDVLKKWGEKQTFYFSPQVIVDKVVLEEFYDVEDPEAYSRNRCLDYTDHLTIHSRLHENGKVRAFYLGEVPRMTDDGALILNGKDRMVIAQLLKSPGLGFRRESRTKKYRYKSEYYDIQKTVHRAEIKPSSGAWLEFEIFETDPKSQISSLPDDLKRRILKDDGWIRVRVRRKGQWFHMHSLLMALGMTPTGSAPDEAITEDEDDDFLATPVGSDEKQFLLKTRLWKEIAAHLKLSPSKTDEETKGRIREILLLKNDLSRLGRYQINRRLERLQRPDLEWKLPKDDLTHLCEQDILGIIAYLKALHAGDALPLDDPLSLANKRVRLLGDLIAEEVMPAILRSFAEALNGRIERAIELKVNLDEETVAGFIRQVSCTNERILRPLRAFMTSSELSQLVPEGNQLAKKSLLRRVTLFGPGGLESVHVKDVRDLHWSHYGRLCPVDTPQSERLGAMLSLPLETRINELGLLTAPYYPVTHGEDGALTIQEGEDPIYLSAADEEEHPGWIAYYDQKAGLLAGQKEVWARCRADELTKVPAQEVTLIDAYPLQQFSLTARMIPFLQHDDANRVLMACSAMRQALPLEKVEPPWIRAGDDKKDPLFAEPLGCNLLVAYLPYKGLNFEDAIVVSESAAKKLTSTHRYEYHVRLREYVIFEKIQSKKDATKESLRPRTVMEQTFREVPYPLEHTRSLDEDGVVRKGAQVGPGDVLVGIADPEQMELSSEWKTTVKAKRSPSWDRSFTVPKGVWGEVVGVKYYTKHRMDKLPNDTWKIIHITLMAQRPLEVGDKLTNRHGGKGVVSAILPDEEMPYLFDCPAKHEHGESCPSRMVEVIINPMSVISRQNPGQLYETHLGWIAAKTRQIPWPALEPFTTNSWQELHEADRGVPNNALEKGKAVLFDPKTHQSFSKATLGYSYMLKLHHLAADKVHGRGYPRYSYNQVSQQPLQGKKMNGGQRLGEMEFWALEGYNARHIIQEMLTLRSDNPEAIRGNLFRAQRFARHRAPEPQSPEFLRVLSFYLLAAGLELELQDARGKNLNILKNTKPFSPNDIVTVIIRPVRAETIEQLSSGEVTDPSMGSEQEGYKDGGLFSQTIFGPVLDQTCKCRRAFHTAGTTKCEKCGVDLVESHVRRSRLGHIRLPFSVFNVIYTDIAAVLLGVSRRWLVSFLNEDPGIQFKKNPGTQFLAEGIDALLLLEMLINASPKFKANFDKKLELKPDDYEPSFQGLGELFGGLRLNFLSASQLKAILKDLSSIELLGKLLEYLARKDRLEAIRALLLAELYALREKEKRPERQRRLQRRLEIIDSFLHSGVKPSDMMIKTLAVLPPDLRPPFAHKHGSLMWGDLNLLYQEILKYQEYLGTESGQARTFRKNIRGLQRRVTGLIDNTKATPPVEVHGEECRQSLAYYLKGKRGFFRGNLLGKRVDYSGRAVIVPDPDLALDECGLPYAMAVQLFKPLLQKELAKDVSVMGYEAKVRRALGTSSAAIQNDLLKRERDEIISVLNNIGRSNPILMNRQPTLHRLGVQAFFPKVHAHHTVTMHPLVLAGFNADFDGDTVAVFRVLTWRARNEAEKHLLASKNLFSPANGSLTLNLGQDIALGMYLCTKDDAKRAVLEHRTGIKFPAKALSKGELRGFLESLLRSGQRSRGDVVKVLDQIKAISFDAATRSNFTLSLFDLPDLRSRRNAYMAADTPDATDKMREEVQIELATNTDSTLGMLFHSEARGSRNDVTKTVTQLIGMRGRMERITAQLPGKDSPVVWSSLREGMNLGEYFVSCYGSRTTLVDKKFGTADAGYVARQLVEIAHRERITRKDCAAEDGLPRAGMLVSPHRRLWLDPRDLHGEKLLAKLSGQFIEEILWLDLKGEKTELAFEQINNPFTKSLWAVIQERALQRKFLGIKIRQVRERSDLVRKLLGRVLWNAVKMDDKTLAAGSLIDNETLAGEVADFLLKAKSKKPTKEDATVSIRSPLACECPEGVCQHCYGWDPATREWPEVGTNVGIISAQSIGEPGTQLVLRTFHHSGVQGMAGISKDIPKVQRFLFANSLAQVEASILNLPHDTYPMLIDAIQSIYQDNGIKISDQHFEVLLKGMLNKVRVESTQGLFYPGKILEKSELATVSATELVVKPILTDINTNITKPASWLSAASFGRTLEALSRAAISESKDSLVGLKENIIIGKLLP